MPEQIKSDPIIRDFLRQISRWRPDIRHLIVFGSRARGNARPDSDYDILVVLPRRSREIEDALYDAVMDTLLDSGRLVSLKIFAKSEFDRLMKLSTPFMQQIREEGVALE